jgi:hypothetical protein
VLRVCVCLCAACVCLCAACVCVCCVLLRVRASIVSMLFYLGAPVCELLLFSWWLWEGRRD